MDANRRTEIMTTTAMMMLGKPYIFGANGATAFDCSGLAIEIARSGGIKIPGDMTAADLYGFLAANHKVVNALEGINEGDFLFFGSSKDKQITHVAYAICPDFMIEAGGGGRQTQTLQGATKKGAMVRIRPIINRSDLLYAVCVL